MGAGNDPRWADDHVDCRSRSEVLRNGRPVKLDPYSASDGIVATLEVSVRDRKRAMVFDITQYTRLWRGNSPVTFATARIQKDEAVTVTFSDEEAEKGALEVRLPSPK
jgi:hypothetical protein